jgi:hypothetical protein
MAASSAVVVLNGLRLAKAAAPGRSQAAALPSGDASVAR